MVVVGGFPKQPRRSCQAAHGRSVPAVPVESVKHTVNDGRENDTRDDKDDHACIQRVQASEDLPAWRYWRLNRSHAAQKHRGVEKRVKPVQALEVRVARHAEGQRTHEDTHGQTDVPRKSLHESFARKDAVVPAFGTWSGLTPTARQRPWCRRTTCVAFSSTAPSELS